MKAKRELSANPWCTFPDNGTLGNGSRFYSVPHVQSEAVAQIEYDAPSRTLFVQFTSGEWYSYFDVPPRVCAAFEAADSHGRFFQEHIRDRYAYKGPLEVPA